MFSLKILKALPRHIQCQASKPMFFSYTSVESFSTKKDAADIPPPQRSTSVEGFGKKFSEKEVEKLLDPMGFVKKDEIPEYEGLDSTGHLKEFKKILEEPKDKKYKYDEHNVKPHVKEMKEEYGFKAKGPEPTRYGDWEKKGRVTDF